MNKLFKKVLSMAVAAAVVVSGVSAPAKKAEAASSAKVRFNAYCYTKDGKWLAGDGSTAKLAATTTTVKKGKAVNVTVTIKGNAAKGIQVLTVDSGNSKLSGGTKGVLATFKSAKYSNVSVKCDGKAVKASYQQGEFEKKEGTKSWRLSFYNTWGAQGDTTKSKCSANAKNIKFKKTCQISFTFTAK